MTFKGEIRSFATRLLMNSKSISTSSRNRTCAAQIWLLVYMLFVLILEKYIGSAVRLAQSLNVLSWILD